MSEETGLYFAPFPKAFDSLQAVVVSVRDGQKRSGDIWSGARWFYREIIFTEPKLLIAPQPEEYDSFDKAVIIAESHLLESEKLSGTLERFSLEVNEKIPVTRNLFLYSLEFIMSHRLAPLWNKIGPFYIKGRDFLKEEKKMCAIKADFSLTDKITLALKAQLVKLPPQQVQEFGVSPNILQQFNQSKTFRISGHSLEKNACLVLPSLKTGYIMEITRQPKDDIDFKRYWKLMYGFRLPVTPAGHDVIYRVRFADGDKIFSYPECCIRSKEPHVFMRCDQKAMFSSFIEDFTSRLPSLCGYPLTFTSSTLYPTKTLYSASISKQANLTRSSVPSSANKAFVFTAEKTSNDAQNLSHGNIRESTIAVTRVSVTPCSQKAYVPCFTKHKLPGIGSKKTSAANDQVTRKTKPIVPCFSMNSESGSNAGTKVHQKKQLTVPRKPASNSNGNVAALGTATKSVTAKRQGTALQQRKDTCTMSKTPSNFTKNVVCPGRATVGRKPDILVRNKRTAGSYETEDFSDKQSQGVSAIANRQTPTQGHVFEMNLTNIDGFKQKRNEKKQKPELDSIMIRKLALENKLSKVSAVAISKWLKTEGVQHKSKTKKPELICKVYEHLKLREPEE